MCGEAAHQHNSFKNPLHNAIKNPTRDLGMVCAAKPHISNNP
jgi:hypothetical protein